MNGHFISIKEAKKAILARVIHAKTKSSEMKERLSKMPVVKTNERGHVVAGESLDIKTKEVAWSRDAFDAYCLLKTIDSMGDTGETGLILSRDQVRWLYAHTAPESVQSLIGEWPKE